MTGLRVAGRSVASVNGLGPGATPSALPIVRTADWVAEKNDDLSRLTHRSLLPSAFRLPVLKHFEPLLFHESFAPPPPAVPLFFLSCTLPSYHLALSCSPQRAPRRRCIYAPRPASALSQPPASVVPLTNSQSSSFEASGTAGELDRPHPPWSVFLVPSSTYCTSTCPSTPPPLP